MPAAPAARPPRSRHPLQPVFEAATVRARCAQVLQSVFSDGLTQVSVFVEPFDARRHQASRSRVGATHSVSSPFKEWWITVVGDVPMATAEAFLKALERKR